MLYPNLSVNEQNHLCISGYDTKDLAAEYGTPLMVLDENVLRERCRTFSKAVADYFPEGSGVLFASKALCIKAMYRIIKDEGFYGADVVSSGELYTAIAAGFPTEKLFFHGNNKTDDDVRFAIESGVGYFVCDNVYELEAIDEEACRHGIIQKILIRVTPGIDPHTHVKINTGCVDSKFGVAIETGQAEELIKLALTKKNISLCGFHCHIGSQMFDPRPYRDALVMMMEFAANIKAKTGYSAGILDMGGGFGVPYTADDPKIDYTEQLKILGSLAKETSERIGLKPAIMMEPGRSIVADAGTTVYHVGGIKHIPGFRNYVSVNGGMADNPRYTLYGSAYTVLAADRMNEPGKMTCSVVGCCCESGDILQENVYLPEMKKGDLLAVLTTGAYNYSMASNYNRLPRPAIVLVGKDGAKIAVKRESYEDLIRNDI